MTNTPTTPIVTMRAETTAAMPAEASTVGQFTPEPRSAAAGGASCGASGSGSVVA
ncbi:hypothetical protein GYA93_24575 [Gordonia desulfuricans]|uniref:Uncharacterized protein n=1 Tax=Gordonia desulfuricans TaxID=89051 RepID=A0A7K3LWN0_9ACTN|nr:hypothetical protein [Gordonia desulfuricans]